MNQINNYQDTHQIIHQKPLLTVFTDASLKGKRGGWGGWAKGSFQDTSIHSSGSFSIHRHNINYAELLALENMLRHIEYTNYSLLNVPMVIQMDNIHGLGVILNHFPNAYPARSIQRRDVPINRVTAQNEYHTILDNIYSLIADSPIVYLKHIKAHQSKGTSNRSSVNNFVDSLAGSHTKYPKSPANKRRARKKSRKSIKALATTKL